MRAIELSENGALKRSLLRGTSSTPGDVASGWLECCALPGAPHASKIHVARTLNKGAGTDAYVTQFF